MPAQHAAWATCAHRTSTGLDRLGGNTKLVFTDLGGAMAACRATLSCNALMLRSHARCHHGTLMKKTACS
jgi:hypothetical protein